MARYVIRRVDKCPSCTDGWIPFQGDVIKGAQCYECFGTGTKFVAVDLVEALAEMGLVVYKPDEPDRRLENGVVEDGRQGWHFNLAKYRRR